VKSPSQQQRPAIWEVCSTSKARGAWLPESAQRVHRAPLKPRSHPNLTNEPEDVCS
jgi:hypothetical protein